MTPVLLVLGALAAPAPGAAPPLVDAAARVDGLVVTLAYATDDNFLHKAVYPKGARCLLREPVAARLARVAKALRHQGLRLKVFDCYRPLSIQREMWKVFPHAGYVADPAKGSMHNRGAAVDLTLVARDGTPLPMPTPFDTFAPASHHGDTSSSPEAQANREKLKAAMEREGFRPNPKEWWHYSAPEARHYPLSDAPL